MNDYNFRKPLTESKSSITESMIRINQLYSSNFSPLSVNESLVILEVDGQRMVMTEGMFDKVKAWIVNLISKEPMMSQILALRRVKNSISKDEYNRRVESIKNLAKSYLIKGGGILAFGIAIAYQTGILKVIEKVIHHLALEPHATTEIAHIVHTVLHAMHLVTGHELKGENELAEAGKKSMIKVALNPNKKIGYQITSVGPGGKRTVDKSVNYPKSKNSGK